MFAGLHAAAQILHHHLLAIADAQDRHAETVDGARRARAALAHHRIRPAREDHRFRGEIAQEIVGHVLERVDFAIDVQFAQAARDQLRHLAAEIYDQQAVMGCLAHALRHRPEAGIAQETRRAGAMGRR